MKNIDLIAGENIKTHFPIRYVAPIMSESLVVTASNSSNNYVYQCDYVDDGWDRINHSCRTIHTPDIVYTTNHQDEHFKHEDHNRFAMYTGRTHLANKGLYEDKAACCPTIYEGKQNMTIDRHSIYDPRFYGFGSDDWRSYVNPILGRVQYDYGEIDFVKLPQFITRNILDTADGPIHLNKLAVDQYTKMQLEQRENFQDEWLQRRADDRLQRKMFPIHTLGKKTS